MTSTSSDARYRAVLERLRSRGRFGINLGLDRTRSLLRELGDPHLQGLRGALIAGTNGKGSTQQLVASVLREAGYRVGQTPKPHLVSYRERITVDGEPISRADFANLVEEVLDHAEAIAKAHGPPTEFEVLTAAAFTWFVRQRVDVAVVEVGLGGRLDATNVWQGGVSAITNVALDHTEHLGPTIEAIAAEKAAIIKRGDSAAITGATEPALEVIQQRTAEMDVNLWLQPPFEVVAMDRTGTKVRTGPGTELLVGLIGRHQAANASVAAGILDALDRQFKGRIFDSPEEFDRGFANARWPGRLEFLPPTDGRPEVLLDGAHNPHGAAALAAAVDELIEDKPVTVLIGVVREKEVAAMLEALRSSRILDRATVITTDVPDTDRSTPAADLARLWPGSTSIADADEALEASLGYGRLVVVCGSLYLVGHVRALLLGLETD
jgi:dihydrofolate synthase/folylpolyglutamate synthase